MDLKNPNTWASKLRRTVGALLPISRDRKGGCVNCGACCKLPNVCWFLQYRQDGSSFCSIYSIRPLNCRKYPRTRSELITSDTCGHHFQENAL